LPAAAQPLWAAAPRATGVGLHVAGRLQRLSAEGKPSPRGSNYQQLLALNRQKNRSSERLTLTSIEPLPLSSCSNHRTTIPEVELSKGRRIVACISCQTGAQETVNCKNPESGTFDLTSSW